MGAFQHPRRQLDRLQQFKGQRTQGLTALHLLAQAGHLHVVGQFVPYQVKSARIGKHDPLRVLGGRVFGVRLEREVARHKGLQGMAAKYALREKY